MLIDSEREQVGQIQSALAEALTTIRTMPGITTRERNRRMARAVLATREELRGVRQASAEREAGERQRAYLAAFGIDPQRSSEERALRRDIETASPGAVDTGHMMEQALRVGDLLQAKAIAAYAFDHRNDELGGDHFRGTLDMYAGHSDGLQRQMVNLAVFDADSGNSGPAKLQRLQDKLLTEVPQPHDLPGNLDYLAADDEPSGNSSASGMAWGA